MKAITIAEAGGPEVLRMHDIDKPCLSDANDVLVKIIAAGVNPGDCQVRQAGAPPYAAGDGRQQFSVPGMDGTGIVEAVGPGITDIRPGDEVWYYDGGYADRHGSYAEYKLINGHYLAKKPETLDFITAAALPVVALTAWEAVMERADVKPGDFVLVHGGAGGVGHISIQLALLRGARVATTVSSGAKQALAHSLGAELVINYRNEDVASAVAAWSGKDGADVVLDYVGRDNFASSMDLVAPYGTLVNTVVADWPSGNNMAAEYKNISVKFVNIGLPQVTANHAYRMRQTRVLQEISRLVDAGKLRVHLDRTYPLSEAGAAHRALEAGEILGRVVITI
ncbi:zinc-binding dehydrogenase [Undibacterium sp. TJN25]